MLSDFVKLCRPHQYLKNGFVLVGVIFGGRGDVALIGRALLAFVAFCAIASAVYVVNDILDVEADRCPSDQTQPADRKRRNTGPRSLDGGRPSSQRRPSGSR